MNSFTTGSQADPKVYFINHACFKHRSHELQASPEPDVLSILLLQLENVTDILVELCFNKSISRKEVSQFFCVWNFNKVGYGCRDSYANR
jgi:hypothetical protein